MDLQSSLEMTESIDFEEKVDIEDLVLPSEPTKLAEMEILDVKKEPFEVYVEQKPADFEEQRPKRGTKRSAGSFASQSKVPDEVAPKKTNALSFYRSQKVLCRSKFFVPDQKSIYILCQSQTFCARQKDDLHSVKLVFVPAQKFLKRH